MSERLKDHVDFIRGVTYGGGEAVMDWQEGYLPILRAGNIQRQLILDSDLVWVPKARVSEEQILRWGDAAICLSSGSPQIVGKSAIFSCDWLGSVGGFCGIVRPREHTDPFFLSCWLRSEFFLKWRDGQARGANIQNLRFNDLGLVEVSFPSIKEQRRIASRLKEQMAAVEQARQRVEAQAEAAELLWASILMEAIDGHRDETWDKRCLGDTLSKSLRTGISKQGTPMAKYRCLGLSAVRNGRLDLAASKPIDLTEVEAERNRILPGAFYVVRGNGNMRLVGRGAIAPDEVDKELVFPDLLIEVNPNPEMLNSNYLRWAWDAPSVRQEIELRSMTSSGIYKINLGNLAKVPLPIPPLKTQRRIAARLREQFDQLQQLKSALASQLSALDALPGAYLREAFGNLA